MKYFYTYNFSVEMAVMFPRVVFCHLEPSVILKCQQNISFPVGEKQHVLSSTYGQFDILPKSLDRHYKLFPHIPNIRHLSCMFELLIGLKKVKH
jgi:hypothetical protein